MLLGLCSKICFVKFLGTTMPSTALLSSIVEMHSSCELTRLKETFLLDASSSTMRFPRMMSIFCHDLRCIRCIVGWRAASRGCLIVLFG